MRTKKRWIILCGIGIFPSLVMAASCSVRVVTGVNFGAYNPFLGVADTTTGRIGINCNQNSNVIISLGAGNSGRYSSRYLLNGSNQLQYNLYSDASYSKIWGDGSGGSSVVSGNNIRSKNFNVYGRALASQDVSVGFYSDTLTITVDF